MASAPEVPDCPILTVSALPLPEGDSMQLPPTCGMQILVCRCARAASSSGSRSSADAAMAAARLFSPPPPLALLPLALAWLAASDRATCSRKMRMRSSSRHADAISATAR